MRRNLACASPSVRTAWFISAALFAVAATAFIPSSDAARVQEPKEFDRLDGHGASSKKIDVVEWEGNLEIHSYPKGSLKSLGLKVDRKSKTSTSAVMVVEYGFQGVPYTMIRRAVLSVKMPDTFHAYRDPSAEDYDKVIISANQLADLPAFALAPPPTQLYPDHHEALTEDAPTNAAPSAPAVVGAPAKTYQRKSASESAAPATPAGAPGIQLRSAEEVEQDGSGTTRRRVKKGQTTDDDGGIRNFAF